MKKREKPTSQVLLVDTDKDFSSYVLEHWELHSVPLLAINSQDELLSVLEQEKFQTIVLSVDALIVDRLDVISFIREHQPVGTEIIVLAQPHQLQTAEEALVKGANSYLLKPVNIDTLHEAVRRNIGRQQNRSNYRLMEDQVLEDLLGSTPAMKKILRTLYKVAPTNSTLLITGESGTGKEFVANIVHRLSKRADEPFVVVNSGAIPESIVESELFGYKKGAFTGAVTDKKGLFEEADRGTLFLDEIGELPLQTQVKLLRFIEDRQIRRLGSTESKKVDVRIIAATNRDLSAAIHSAEPTFREDLFFRLNTFQIHMPPLRERMGTLPSLVKHFMLKFCREHEKTIDNIEPAALLALSRYHYPGNIRELANILEHAIVMSDDGIIRIQDLPEGLTRTPERLALPAGASAQNLLTRSASLVSPSESAPLSDGSDGNSTGDTLSEEFTAAPLAPSGEESTGELLPLAELERRHILLALQRLDNNQTEVAKQLGISRSTLWRKLQEYKIKL